MRGTGACRCCRNDRKSVSVVDTWLIDEISDFETLASKITIVLRVITESDLTTEMKRMLIWLSVTSTS